MMSKVDLLERLFKSAILMIAFGLLVPTTAKAQLPPEAICGENAWGAGRTSQRLIDSKSRRVQYHTPSGGLVLPFKLMKIGWHV
jgi:hypothetical protein